VTPRTIPEERKHELCLFFKKNAVTQIKICLKVKASFKSVLGFYVTSPASSFNSSQQYVCRIKSKHELYSIKRIRFGQSDILRGTVQCRTAWKIRKIITYFAGNKRKIQENYKIHNAAMWFKKHTYWKQPRKCDSLRDGLSRARIPV